MNNLIQRRCPLQIHLKNIYIKTVLSILNQGQALRQERAVNLTEKFQINLFESIMTKVVSNSAFLFPYSKWELSCVAVLQISSLVSIESLTPVPPLLSAKKTFKHISVDIFPVKGLHNSENICFSVCSDCFHSRSEQEKNREWSGECLLGFLLLEEEKVEVRHFKWFLNKIHSQL